MGPDKSRIWLTHGYNEVIVNGFSHFNIDDLSVKVKIAKTSFYHFFHSREAFITELVNFWATEEWGETAKSLEEVTMAKTPEAFVVHKQSHMDFYCFLIRPPTPHLFQSYQRIDMTETNEEWLAKFKKAYDLD